MYGKILPNEFIPTKRRNIAHPQIFFWDTVYVYIYLYLVFCPKP